MKKLLLVLLVLGLAVGAALVGGRWLFGRDTEEVVWTTRSPQAREELEEALADFQRYYWPEARQHLERALELDPDFAIAKLYLVNVVQGRGDGELIRELRSTSIGHLSEREQLLLKYADLRHDGEFESATALLDDYLERQPDDPYALDLRCEYLWRGEDSATEAAECFREMIERHPNWVLARNRLGYLEMARAQFDQAEQEFRTYQYIAPDQANPYDSLGELLTMVGRYEEAEEALSEALSIKADFCDAYNHLGSLYLLWGLFEEAPERLAASDADFSCRKRLEKSGYACKLEIYSRYQAGELEQAWQALEACEDQRGLDLWRYRLALATGRPEVAATVESSLLASRRKRPGRYPDGLVLSMEGLRRMHEGEPEFAAELFEGADRSFTYESTDSGRAKLFNLLHWALALEAAGRDAEAAKVRQDLAAVNPRYQQTVRITDLPQSLPATDR